MPLYGSFPVQTHNADGSLSGNLAPGVHYTADAPTMAAFSGVLTQYVATHTWPLQFAMAGDDPAAPANSFPICFPDTTTAATVLAQTNPAPPPGL